MGRTLLVVTCAAAAVAAPILWNLHRESTAHRKLAEEAARYRQLADKGDANAQFELGRMCFWGRGVPQDYRQADYWYQKAADQGFAKGEDGVGALYYYGHGLQQSYADALVWYRKAADQGDAIAQEALGGMYYNGNGVPRNYVEAMAWSRKAADQGYAKAEYDVGLLYDYGLGVPRNRDEADRWYRKAASHGDEDAQRWLGLRLSPLRPWVRVTQTILAAGSVLLMSGLFAPKRLRDTPAPRLGVGGALSFLSIAMYLFEHSKYCLFPSAWLALAFRFVTLFLGGVVITLLATAFRPRAGKALLVFSGILLVVLDLRLCTIARFDLHVISTNVMRFLTIDATPLGIAISTAIHLWRRKKSPTDDSSDSAPESSEAPHAV